MQKDYAICLLQETHSGEQTHNTRKQKWGKDAFFSGRHTNSEGIRILINSTISCTIQNYKDIVSGRLQALERVINDTEFIINNVHDPSSDDTSNFETLEKYINKNNEKNIHYRGRL